MSTQDSFVASPFRGFFLSVPFAAGVAAGLALGGAALIYAA